MSYSNALFPHVRGGLQQQLHTFPIHSRSPANTRKIYSGIRTVSSSSPSSASSSNNPPSPVTFKPANRLSGKTCLITGGSSGIGFAIADRFLQEGAKRVIIAGRSPSRLLDAAVRLGSLPPDNGDVMTRVLEEAKEQEAKEQEAKEQEAKEQEAKEQEAKEQENKEQENKEQENKEQESKEQKNIAARLLFGKVSKVDDRISFLTWDFQQFHPPEVEKAHIRELENLMEPVDILVNAAGIAHSYLLTRIEPKAISQTLRTNLEGAIIFSRAMIRASIRARLRNLNRNKKQPEGKEGKEGKAEKETPPLPMKCIINISSLLAHKAGTGAVPYAASKAGLLGLTRSLAVETASSFTGAVIRSNVIVPGFIDTPMTAGILSEEKQLKTKAKIPLRRFGHPSEVADAAVFLAQNEYANNCVLNLDGGLSAF